MDLTFIPSPPRPEPQVKRNLDGTPRRYKPLVHDPLPEDRGGKLCATCAEWLTLDSFVRDGSGEPNGRVNYCRQCQREARQGVREHPLLRTSTWGTKPENKPRVAQKNLARSLANPERMLFTYALRRANLLDLAFDISVSDIQIPEVCPAFGFPLVRNIGTGSDGKGLYNSPSIDRIVPALGYVRGNIQVISRLANSIKGHKSLEEMHAFARWILTVQNPEGYVPPPVIWQEVPAGDVIEVE